MYSPNNYTHQQLASWLSKGLSLAVGVVRVGGEWGGGGGRRERGGE